LGLGQPPPPLADRMSRTSCRAAAPEPRACCCCERPAAACSRGAAAAAGGADLGVSSASAGTSTCGSASGHAIGSAGVGGDEACWSVERRGVDCGLATSPPPLPPLLLPPPPPPSLLAFLRRQLLRRGRLLGANEAAVEPSVAVPATAAPQLLPAASLEEAEACASASCSLRLRPAASCCLLGCCGGGTNDEALIWGPVSWSMQSFGSGQKRVRWRSSRCIAASPMRSSSSAQPGRCMTSTVEGAPSHSRALPCERAAARAWNARRATSGCRLPSVGGAAEDAAAAAGRGASSADAASAGT